MRYSPILLVHITAGLLGILSGTAAVLYRKGSPRHALAGNIFVIVMLTMAASAIYLAIVKNQMNNLGGGLLTFYLIGTAWLTARRRRGETRLYDWLALVIPLGIGILGWTNGIEALRTTGEKYGVPAGMHLFMGTICLLAAAGDIRILLRGGPVGTPRIIRHLWRMCFGFFIATGSFFLGQAEKVFPSLTPISTWLILPAILPLLLLIFWFLKVRLSKSYLRPQGA
jgi:uncharacterized membrane protein